MLRTVVTSIILYFISQLICVGKLNVLPERKEMIFYNFLSIFCFFSLLNIFIYNYRLSFLIIITIFYLLSLTMYYVHEFRGTNINFSDILSINTAKEVAGGYKYEIKIVFVLAFILLIFEYIFQINNIKNIDGNIIFFRPITNLEIYNFFWNEVLRVFLFFISFFLLKDKISQRQYDYSLNAGENEGYVYNFVSSIPIFHRNNLDDNELDISNENIYKSIIYISKENLNNHNTKNSQNYDDILNSTNIDELPHIIVVMNESFGSAHNRIKTNIPVTPYFDGLNGVTKGNLFVNTFGGGTANTEFEFLTGMTIGNYSYPVMPYNNFVKRDKYSIARYFNILGYKTIAMHPYTATNYHRDKVYKRFGFSELLFFDDFKNKKYVRNFVSDEAMYEEIIRRFETTSNNSQKLFLFGITMQNHSGYNHFDDACIFSSLINNRCKDALDSYLSLMKISDDAIKVLIDYFDNIKEHVIILFFGDHNASFGTKINKIVFENNLEYECTNAYVTPFFIYDNKDKKSDFINEISANFLSLELLKKANLPFDELHEMLNSIYENYSVYNFHKAKNRIDNKLYDIPFDEFMKLEKEYLK